MYSYNIAICDDESYYREEIIKMFAAYQSESGNQLTIDDYPSGEALLDILKKENKKYDFFILDVEMGRMSGVETARAIRKEDEGAVIIFATSHNEYALDAFDIGAAGYLTKPVDYVGLKRIMKQAVIMADFYKDKKEAEKRYLEISAQSEKNYKVEMERIIYIEKKRNSAHIHTEDGECCCYETLAQLYDKLDQRNFTYCHQGYIINFSKIKDVEKTKICFGYHLEIPLSRRYYKELRERFLECIHSGGELVWKR